VTENELAAPVIAPFEIRVRLDPWLLFPAIVLGFLLGFLLRVLLKRFIDHGVAQSSGYEVIEKIKGYELQESDAIFLTAAANARTTIAEAFDADSATLTAAIASAAAAVQTARVDLQVRLDTLAEAINDTRKITKATNFPDEIDAVLRTADDELEAVEALLAARNAARGTAEIVDLKERMAAGVADAAADWRTEVRNALAGIDSLPPRPTRWAATLATGAKNLGTTLDTMLSDTTNVKAMLDGVNTARFQALHDVARGAIEPNAEYAESVAEEFENTPAVAQTIRDAARALRDAIANDRALILKEPIRALDALLTAMRTATLGAAPAEHRDSILALLDEGKYEEAARAATTGEGASAEAEGAAPEPRSESRSPEPWQATFEASAASPQIDIATGGGRMLLRWKLAMARALNSVGIGILLALAGFAFLYPGFDGTLRGLLAAFFWGYASDFSAEAITQAAKK
jgi:hypothetical protein